MYTLHLQNPNNTYEVIEFFINDCIENEIEKFKIVIDDFKEANSLKWRNFHLIDNDFEAIGIIFDLHVDGDRFHEAILGIKK